MRADMTMQKTVMYLAIAVLTGASLSYVSVSRPEMLDSLLLRVDVLGITEAGAKEKQRIETIRSLEIPFEKKKVLMERTIFMGASRQMVYLALGEPRKAQRYKTPISGSSGKDVTEEWVYFFKGDSRPTVLEFKGQVLIGAHKTSKLDVK